jgi:hypothetical protein
MVCDHALRSVRVKKLGPDGKPTHVGWQCEECFDHVKVGGGIWIPKYQWPRHLPGWIDERTGETDESLTVDTNFSATNDASLLPASSQFTYVKLAAKHGDWRALQKHNLEPTDTMKVLFIQMRAKYLEWKKRRDEEEEREAALPKFWFEITPGHWVRVSSEEKALAWVESMKPVEAR